MLAALGLLCQAYSLSKSGQTNLPFIKKDQLEKTIQMPTWWRRPFQEFKDAKTFTASLEVEWGGKLPAALTELVSKMFPSELATKERRNDTFSPMLVEQVSREIGKALRF
jgi:hypothetical protein